METLNISNLIKTAGAVILYHPDNKIINSVIEYIHQVDILIVWDNTELANLSTLSVFKSIPNVILRQTGENLGIAKALNQCAMIAIGNKCKYLLTMDQDSNVSENMISSLVKVAESSNSIGLVTPVHRNRFYTSEPDDVNVIEVKVAKASGNLINLNIWEKCKGFNEKYFIDYVDIEYCWRLRLNHYTILQDNSIRMPHSEANLSRRNFFFRKVFPYNNSPIRMYYKTRNLIYLVQEYHRLLPHEVKHEISVYMRNLLKLLLFEDQKYLKLKMIFKGVIAAFTNKSGGIHD